jgi:hypothetical protein
MEGITMRPLLQDIELTSDERFQFEELVDASVVARYEGDLERGEDPKTGGVYYVPLDDVRDVLMALWGELLTPQAIEDTVERLTTEGAEYWPHGWCEEDEENRPISDFDDPDDVRREPDDLEFAQP